MRPFGVHVGDVCFVHWPVDQGVLDTRLPYALSPAIRQGTAWVSLLAMRTRPLAGPLGLPGEFSQVTLRTYVEVGVDGPDAVDEDGHDGQEPEEAVYFLRVDSDGWLATLGARRVFGVAFQNVDAGVAVDGSTVDVHTHTPTGTLLYDATFQQCGVVEPVESNSLVGWLTDREVYALDDGRTGRVDHDEWRVAETTVTVEADGLLGSEGLPDALGDPIVRYSPGADFALKEWPS